MIVRLSLIAVVVLASIVGIGTAEAKKRSPKDQVLYERAVKECNGPKWPGGATITINYSQGWYRCDSRNSR